MWSVQEVFAVLLLALSAVLVASGNATVDPYREEGFACEGKPDGRLLREGETFAYGFFRLRADFNFDGREDLILTEKDGGTCASANCSTAIFLRTADGGYAKATLRVHPLDVMLRKLKPGVGALQVYVRSGPRDGVESTRRISLARGAVVLSLVSNEAVTWNDAGEEVFGKPRKPLRTNASPMLRLQPEFARCKAGVLGWSDSYE